MCIRDRHWDVKVLQLLDAAHQAAGVPAQWDAGQTGENAPYGVYNGLTLTEAGGPNETVLGYLPAESEWRSPNFYEDTSTGYKGGAYGLSTDGASLPEHQAWFFYLMRICNHCTYPACLAACPREKVHVALQEPVQVWQPMQRLMLKTAANCCSGCASG